jgi:hypothetical protein
LWYETLRREKPSKFYRFLLWSHIISNVAYISFVMLIIQGFVDQHLVSGFIAVMMFGLCVPSVFYFAVVLLALLRRWKIFYQIYLVQAVLFFGLSSATTVGLLLNRAPLLLSLFSAGLVLVAVAQFFMALNLGEDFTYDRHRILLRPDPDIRLGPDFLSRGKEYARQKMWAMAVLHFQRASYRLPESLNPYLSLAVAYYNLKMYDRMADPLRQAEKLRPHDERVKKLIALMYAQPD